MKEKFSIGDIALSRAGRDKGHYFVIMEVDDTFAEICDGDLHKTDKPKKKKLKHLKKTDGYSQYIKDKLLENLKVTNTELRRAISEFEDALV